MSRHFLLISSDTDPVYSVKFTYTSVSFLQDGLTPLDLDESNSQEEVAGVHRRHGTKRSLSYRRRKSEDKEKAQEEEEDCIESKASLI